MSSGSAESAETGARVQWPVHGRGALVGVPCSYPWSTSVKCKKVFVYSVESVAPCCCSLSARSGALKSSQSELEWCRVSMLRRYFVAAVQGFVFVRGRLYRSRCQSIEVFCKCSRFGTVGRHCSSPVSPLSFVVSCVSPFCLLGAPSHEGCKCLVPWKAQ